MKIAIVRSFPSVLDSSQYNVQEFGLAKALLLCGISTDVYCAGNDNETSVSVLEEKNNSIARVIHLRCIEVAPHNGIFPELLQLLKNGSYDLIQAQDFEQITVFRTARFAVAHKIPFVIHQGVYDNRKYGKFQKLWIKFFRGTCGCFLAKNTSACIAKTDVAKKYLAKAGFSNITVLPIGLNSSRFSQPDKKEWRTTLGVGSSTNILLYIGIIEERRNVDFLIRVTDKLIKSGHSVCLVIAGSGPQQTECEELVRALNLENNVMFLGMVKQKDLPSLYDIADLFLLASNSEIVGMVLLESLYFNVPIFSTATAGGMDIVDTRFGKVFNSLDENDWSKEISCYLTNLERSPFNKKALADIPFERSWDTLSEKYAAFYRQLVAKK